MSDTSGVEATLLLSPDERDIYRTQAAALNNELSTTVHDSLSTAAPMLQEAVALLQDWRSRWASFCDRNAETISKYDSGYAHPVSVNYTTETLDQEVCPALNTAWVFNYGSVPQKLESVTDVLDDVFRGIVAPQKRQEALSRLEAFAARVLPLGQHEVVPSTFALHDLQHADPLALLKAEFSKSAQHLSILESQVAQTIEDREACLRSEDVKGAEERALDVVSGMKALIKTAYGRYHDAQAASADVAQFTDNVQTVMTETTHHLEDGIQENTQIRTAATNDLAGLRTFYSNFAADAQSKSDAYQAKAQQFKAQLSDNTKSQMHVWDHIIQHLQELHKLSQIREELVSHHMADTAAERLRQRHQAELEQAVTLRTQQLEALTINVDRALEYLSATQQYSRKAQEFIHRCQHPEKLFKFQVEESLRSYDVYKRYILTANGLLLRREQRLENMRRLLRSTEFQITNAIETLDTDLPLYRAQLATLQQTELQLSNVVQQMTNDVAEEADRWMPIEHFLDGTAKVEYDPPSLIVQELKRDMTRHHVDAVDELTNKEQKLLDAEKASVRKMLTAVEAAKEAFRDRKGSPSPPRTR